MVGNGKCVHGVAVHYNQRWVLHLGHGLTMISMVSMVMVTIVNRTLVSMLDTEWMVVLVVEAGAPPRYNSLPLGSPVTVSTVSMVGVPMMTEQKQ